jgi:CcmD family protein
MTAFAPQTPAPGASGTTPNDAPDARSTEFTAVDPNVEHFNGSTLLVEAYAAIWVVLMAWIFLLWRKQAGLSERLDDLERTIDRAAASAEKKAKLGAS